jgi:hypothetical protein
MAVINSLADFEPGRANRGAWTFGKREGIVFSRNLDSAPDHGGMVLPCPNDLRVAALAKQRLCGSHFPALHEVRCDFRDGVLTLSGTVPSTYLRELAEWLVTPLEGVGECANGLLICAEARAG